MREPVGPRLRRDRVLLFVLHADHGRERLDKVPQQLHRHDRVLAQQLVEVRARDPDQVRRTLRRHRRGPRPVVDEGHLSEVVPLLEARQLVLSGVNAEYAIDDNEEVVASISAEITLVPGPINIVRHIDHLQQLAEGQVVEERQVPQRIERKPDALRLLGLLPIARIGHHGGDVVVAALLVGEVHEVIGRAPGSLCVRKVWRSKLSR